jgi:hypothetical protein
MPNYDPPILGTSPLLCHAANPQHESVSARRVGRPERGREVQFGTNLTPELDEALSTIALQENASRVDLLCDCLAALAEERLGFRPPAYLGDPRATWALRSAPGAEASVSSHETGPEKALPLVAVVAEEAEPVELAEEAQEKLTAAVLWAQLVPLLVEECGAEFETVWLPGLALGRLSSACLYLVCQNEYYRDRLIADGLPGILGRLAGGLLGRSVSVVLKAKKERQAPPVAAVAAPAVVPAPGVPVRRLSPELAKIEKRKEALRSVAQEESIALRSVAASLLQKQWTQEDKEEAQQRAQRLERMKAVHAARQEKKNGNKGSPP